MPSPSPNYIVNVALLKVNNKRFISELAVNTRFIGNMCLSSATNHLFHVVIDLHFDVELFNVGAKYLFYECH